MNQLKRLYRFIGLGFLVFCMVLNLTQTYQFTHGILMVDETMDFERYKTIFMATSARYKNYLPYKVFAEKFNGLQVKESIYLNKSDTLLKAGDWRGLPVITYHFEPGQEYYMNIEMQLPYIEEINQDAVLWICITDTLNNSQHYEQRCLWHFTDGRSENQILHYYFKCLGVPDAQQLHFGFQHLPKEITVGPVKVNTFK